MDKAAKKRMLNSISSAKAFRQDILQKVAASETTRTRRAQALLEQNKAGLGGRRLGKHRVSETAVDVQLGEDLSESLRGLKASLYFLRCDTN